LYGFKPQVAMVDARAAQAIWQQSPEATPFVHPAVLGALSAEVRYRCASFAGQPVCLWPVCRDHSRSLSAPQFSYYVGPIWAAGARTGSAREQVLKRAAVIDALCTAIVAADGAFELELAPDDLDIRAFRWWAQDRGTAPALTIEIEYTGRIALAAGNTANSLQEGFSKSLRQAALKTARDAALKACGWTSEDCFHLYRQMSARQRDLSLLRAPRSRADRSVRADRRRPWLRPSVGERRSGAAVGNALGAARRWGGLRCAVAGR